METLEAFSPLEEIEETEILNRINTISEDDDTRKLVLRYADLYLNTWLRKTNEPEKYELSRITGSLEDIENEDNAFKAKIQEIELLLLNQADRIKSE